jgi:hypothetical protein
VKIALKGASQEIDFVQSSRKLKSVLSETAMIVSHKFSSLVEKNLL